MFQAIWKGTVNTILAFLQLNNGMGSDKNTLGLLEGAGHNFYTRFRFQYVNNNP